VGISHPLHRRKLLLGINRLKEAEAVEVSLTLNELDDYLARLDNNRIQLVARLKAAFDLQDQERTGHLTPDQVQAAFDHLGESLKLHTDEVTSWLQKLRNNGENVRFAIFVDKALAFSLHQGEEGKGQNGNESSRIKMVGRHVKLREVNQEEDAKAPKKSALEKLADSMKTEDDADSDVLFRRPKRQHDDGEEEDWDSIKRVRNNHTFVSMQCHYGVTFDPLSHVQLAVVKAVFDRFAVDGLMTVPEAIQALLEIGCTAPRKLVGRGSYRSILSFCLISIILRVLL